MLFLSPAITIYILTLAFVIGAVMASFLGCLGWRISNGESILRGRSHCDACGHPLKGRDLIPILSYMMRKGRCAYCNQPIPKSTVYGELLLAVTFVLTTLRFDVTWECLMMLMFISILYLVAMVDIYTRIIPDSALALAIVIRLLYFFLVEGFSLGKIIVLLLDGLSISLPLLIVVLLMEKVLKKEAMGGGDIKLLFVIGLFVGWEKNMLCILLACILGIIGGYIQIRNEESKYFAFGPYLAASAVLSLLVGDAVIGWYMSLLMGK